MEYFLKIIQIGLVRTEPFSVSVFCRGALELKVYVLI